MKSLGELLICIIIGLLLLSCNKSPEITNDDRLNFLNEILSDTTDLKIIDSKKTLICNDTKIYPILAYEKGGDAENIASWTFTKISPIQKISNLLEVKDTLFIEKQISQNKDLDIMELSRFNFNVFNLKKHFEDKTPKNVYTDLISKENLKNGLSENSGYLFINKPIFNKSMDKAFIRYQRNDIGSSKYYVVEKVNGNWVKKN